MLCSFGLVFVTRF